MEDEKQFNGEPINPGCECAWCGEQTSSPDYVLCDDCSDECCE